MAGVIAAPVLVPTFVAAKATELTRRFGRARRRAQGVTMDRFAILAVLLSLFASLPAGAQELAHSQFIPIVARTSGAGGTMWVSDVTVYNATDSELVVGVQFLIADQADVLPDPCATQFPNMFIAYVSKVDGNPQGTGDAEFIYAAPTEPYNCVR
jgi:hypothetical protein